MDQVHAHRKWYYLNELEEKKKKIEKEIRNVDEDEVEELKERAYSQLASVLDKGNNLLFFGDEKEIKDNFLFYLRENGYGVYEKKFTDEILKNM